MRTKCPIPFHHHLRVKLHTLSATSGQNGRRVTCRTHISSSVPVAADGGGLGVYADSSCGEEDHAVRHGCGTDQEVRSRWLSGPQHQVTQLSV